MTQTRDLTEAQYRSAMHRHGFVANGFLGYWKLPLEGRNLNVSDHNAGPRRRAKLAYMLRELQNYQRAEKGELVQA